MLFYYSFFEISPRRSPAKKDRFAPVLFPLLRRSGRFSPLMLPIKLLTVRRAETPPSVLRRIGHLHQRAAPRAPERTNRLRAVPVRFMHAHPVAVAPPAAPGGAIPLRPPIRRKLPAAHRAFPLLHESRLLLFRRARFLRGELSHERRQLFDLLRLRLDLRVLRGYRILHGRQFPHHGRAGCGETGAAAQLE